MTFWDWLDKDSNQQFAFLMFVTALVGIGIVVKIFVDK